MIPLPQPIRYGSKTMAKTNALFCVTEGSAKDDHARNRPHIACFGNKSHYERGSGVCAHVENYAAAMKPWYLSRAVFLPFGENGREEARVTPAPESERGMKYETGRYYQIPHVRCQWPDGNRMAQWIPVLGPSHTDIEVIKFEHEHWHVDFRFLAARVKKVSIRWGVPGGMSSGYRSRGYLPWPSRMARR